ncbi:MAG: hypothetical protein FJX48_10000 [Alphaproteobacteria bacterium]|nr:hypothetical protein [Alphaproteobacteria bacterium]
MSEGAGLSKYLDRLRALESEKRLPWQPSKPSKVPFEGFEGDPRKGFLEPLGPFGVSEGELGKHVSAVAPRRSMVFRPMVTRLTDRFCDCGRLATLAFPNSSGRKVWFCLECLNADGKA